jgi:TM2 domain-containing membrane protein YozV
MAFCQRCGAQLNEGANFCIRCGAPVPGLAAVATPPAATQTAEASKSLSTTLLLALLLGIMGIWGIGHFYLGKAGAGIAFLIGGFIIGIGTLTLGILLGLVTFGIATIFFGLLWLAGYAFQAVDAYNCAKAMGAR